MNHSPRTPSDILLTLVSAFDLERLQLPPLSTGLSLKI